MKTSKVRIYEHLLEKHPADRPCDMPRRPWQAGKFLAYFRAKLPSSLPATSLTLSTESEGGKRYCQPTESYRLPANQPENDKANGQHEHGKNSPSGLLSRTTNTFSYLITVRQMDTFITFCLGGGYCVLKHKGDRGPLGGPAWDDVPIKSGKTILRDHNYDKLHFGIIVLTHSPI